VPIPDYETIMLPLLKFASDANEHSAKEAIESWKQITIQS
jgi:restriction endonuclease Mrr